MLVSYEIANFIFVYILFVVLLRVVKLLCGIATSSTVLFSWGIFCYLIFVSFYDFVQEDW